MIKQIFEDNDEWKKMEKILLSWLHTPYRHLQMAKGRGADCTLFIADAWREYGILSKVTFDSYSEDWYLHTNNEYIVDGIIKHIKSNFNSGYGAKQIKDIQGILRGDLLCFSTTERNVSNHCAVYMNNDLIIHSVRKKEVCLYNFKDYWKKRIKNIYRITKEE